MKRQTAKWVRKAEDDLIGARKLASGQPPLHDLVCFHCEPSAEKYLKALLIDRGVAPPRTHDLLVLLTLLLPLEPTLKSLRRRLTALTRYAVEFRYPIRRADRRKAQAALRYAESARKGIRHRLGLSP
jgi:HEPN domain-containing protein